MKEKAIFFVEAPFQLMSAYEAISSFHIKNYSIVVRLSNTTHNDVQLKKLVELLFKNNKNIKFLSLSIKNRTLSEQIKVLSYILYIFVVQTRYKYIFIGNMESGFLSLLMKFIKKRKIFLLDDGIKSITFQNMFDDNYNYNLYTMLDKLEAKKDQIIIYNYFTELKKMISSVEYSNEVLFIGSKVSEVGIVSEETYIMCLKRIAKHYEDETILYVVHRGENDDKLSKIGKIKNIKIIKIDYPIELYPIFTNKIPKNIASFYSAALISFLQLYTTVEVKSFLLKKLLSNEKEVKQAYDYIKIYMEIVELDE